MKHKHPPKIKVLNEKLWGDDSRNMLEFTISRPEAPTQEIKVKYYGKHKIYNEVATDIYSDYSSINGDALYDLIVLLTNIYSNNMDQYYET